MSNLNFTEIEPISKIRTRIKEMPRQDGVYKQYIDEKGLRYLEGVMPTTKEITFDGKEVYLLYIGRTKNLFDRLKSHLGFTNTSHGSIVRGFISTLRVSYMANHKDITCLSQGDELNKFMDEHIYIQYMVTEDFILIEEQLIKDNDLPLNIKGNVHSFVKTNKLRRKQIKSKYLDENI